MRNVIRNYKTNLRRSFRRGGIIIDIIFNSELLNHEQRYNVIEFLNTKLAELELIIELSTLERIIITDHFTEDVIKVQREYNMREVGHTDRNDGIAIAKVLHTSIQEVLKQTIIITVNIIVGFFSSEYAPISFHYLHHELCHVHDNFYQHKIFTIEARAGKGINKLQHTLIYNAGPIWSEYIAVRLSAGSVNISDSIDLSTNTLNSGYLIQLIGSCKENIVKAIQDYRLNADTHKLFIYLQEETSLLFKIAATTQAYIDGLGISESNFAEKLNEFISTTYFSEAWKKQWEALRLLFNIYPNWNDVYQLNELGEAIKTCWNDLGMFASYIEEKDSIYLDIPF